ncbi:MAG: hypothetical protein AB6733_14535 [Clostridiaceae bacterium]
MANINKISEGQIFSDRKSTKKLSFDKGEVFSARVIAKDDGKSEVILKLSDGWQFPAKLDKETEIAQDQSSRFQVVGFEDGKIKIVPLKTETKNEDGWNSSIENLIKSSGMGLTKEDINVLKEMIKHNIPLTKENISEIKSLLFCKTRLNADENYGAKFIEKYLASKNIDPNSSEGKAITEKLQKFFNELKNISSKDLLTLLENSIPLDGDNLESFNRIVKGDKTIYNEIKNIDNSKISKPSDNPTIKGGLEAFTENEINNAIKNFSLNDNTENRQAVKDIINIKEALNIQNIDKNTLVDILSKNPKVKEAISNSALNMDKVLNLVNEIKDSSLELIVFNNIDMDNNLFDENTQKILTAVNDAINDNKVDVNTAEGGKKNGALDNITFFKEILTNTDVKAEDLAKIFVKNKEIIHDQGFEKKIIDILDDIKNIPPKALQELEVNSNINKALTTLKEEILLQRNEAPLSQVVKNEMSLKLEDMKTIIKTLISEDNVVPQDLINMFKDSFKDFKTFNDLSNNYYMLDIPLNINQDQYGCKLLIKDERKNGKTIDSKNVKIVATVKTINMGEVDSYIAVTDKTMKLDIKCDENWVGLLSKFKNNISKSLSDLGFYPYIEVSKKFEDANIVTTREFFDDSKHVGINIKV